MRIEKANVEKKFKDIQQGEVFTYEGEYFMKVDGCKICSLVDSNAIILEKGCHVYFYDDCEVNVVEGKFVVGKGEEK